MGGGTISEVIGLMGSIVVLAAIALAIKNGSKTALIIQRTGQAFSGSIKAATLR